MTNEQGMNAGSNKHTLRRTIGLILALIVLLFVFTSAILASRLVELVGREDRPVLLEAGKNSEVVIFEVEYENGQGRVTVKGANDQKIVAPGTECNSFVYFKNADSTAIDYIMQPKVTFASSEYRIPLQVRLLAPDGNYIVGASDTWEPIEALNSIPAQANTLGKGQEVVYTLEWKWDFHSEDPEDADYDTFLGDAVASGTDIGIEIAFSTLACANTTMEANGGFVASGMLLNVIYGVAWLVLLAALVLVIVALIKEKKAN